MLYPTGSYTNPKSVDLVVFVFSSVFHIQRAEHLNAKASLNPFTPPIRSFASEGECDFMFKKSFCQDLSFHILVIQLSQVYKLYLCSY